MGGAARYTLTFDPRMIIGHRFDKNIYKKVKTGYTIQKIAS